MTASTDQPALGKFLTNGVQASWSLAMDALATQPVRGAYALCVLSAVGSSTEVKAVKAALQGKPIPNCRATVPGKYPRSVHRLYPMKVSLQKLGLDSWHLLAVADTPLLLPCHTNQSLWARLSSHDFTTPLLRDWMGWVNRQLEEEELLIKLDCFRCEAAMLCLNDAGLDDVVAHGVREGHLTIA